MNKKMIKCNSCGNEIKSNAKICSNCGVKNKKPFYKKWWLWLIVVIVFIAAIGHNGSDEEMYETGETTTSTITKESDVDTAIDKNVTEDYTANYLEESETKAAKKMTVTEKNELKETIGQKNARKKAESYLDYSAFSRSGLIEQLEFEGFSNEDAVYAVNHCDVDWNEQSLEKAKSYLDYSSFSYDGLIDQLEFEGFTLDQAKYGVDNCGADWNEQAAKKAESYLEYSSFSRDGLIDQLEFEGFTHEQAVYGVEAVGY